MGVPKQARGLRGPATLEELMLVPDYQRADALVRAGVDSVKLVVATEAESEPALARARQGVAEDRGPLPLQPYRSGYRSLVVMPTFDEVDNLEAILRDVFAYLDTDVLVIDDASPDGTGDLADRLAADEPRLHVLHRTGKQGLGTAYLLGFARAIEQGYDRVLEMDADFSHPPWDLPRLVEATSRAQLAIGSRYVAGGSTIGWDFKRRALSRGANLYTRLVLGMKVRDATAGFRCYDVPSLAKLDLSHVKAEGYAFQVEMAYRMWKAGFQIREVPIHFKDRTAGESKMDSKIAREAIVLVPALRWRVKKKLLRENAG